jgi:glycerol uptake facilitator-like aquaporin
MDDKTLRVYMAEMIGTFAFVLISAGSAYIAALVGSGPGEAWRQPGLVWVALAAGLMYAATLAWTVPISGGYLNPAVPIMLWVFRRMDGVRAGLLIGVQLLGAVIAGLALYFLPSQEPARMASHLGAPYLNFDYLGVAGSSSMAVALKGIGIELVLTFLLVLSIFGTQLDPRVQGWLRSGAGRLSFLWIGLTLVACTFVGFPLTGAALNPARWLGPALWDLTQHPNAFQYHAPYWIGPIGGALLAGWLYTAWVLPEEEERPVAAAPPLTTKSSTAASTLYRAKR